MVPRSFTSTATVVTQMTLCLRDVSEMLDATTVDLHFSQFGTITTIAFDMVEVPAVPYYPSLRRDVYVTFADIRHALAAHTRTRNANRYGQSVQLVINQ